MRRCEGRKPFGRRRMLALAVAAAVDLRMAHCANATVYTWNPTGTASWNTPGDWNPVGTLGTGDTATILGNSSATLTLDASQSVGGLIFANSSTSLIEGSASGAGNQTLTIGTGGITINSGAGAVTIGSGTSGDAANITLNGSQTWANNSNNLFTDQNSITNSMISTLTITGSGTGGAVLNGVISDGSTPTAVAIGTGGNSSAVYTLNAFNTYSGGTTVNGGTLTLSATGGATGKIRGALTINSGGTVAADSNWSLGYGNGTCVSSIFVNGGTLNFTGAALGGGTSATAITMTGGTLSGAQFDWYNGITSTPTLTTNASSNSATISSGFRLRLSNNNLTLNVAQGTTSNGVDLLISGPVTSAFSSDGIVKTGGGAAVISGAIGSGVMTTVNAGTLVLSGANTSNDGLTVTGGTLDITGTNTGTGAVSVTGGNLKLDFSATGAPGANILNSSTNSSGLTLASGALAITGKSAASNSQQLNGVTLIGGASTIALNANGAANLLLTLGTITRGAAAGSVDFTLPAGGQSSTNGITVSNTNTANGILGAWATVGGTDWATNSTNAAGGNVTAYSGYTNLAALGSTISNGSMTNVRINTAGSGGNVVLGSATTTVNTLLQDTTTTASTVATAGDIFATSGIMIGSGSQALTVGAAVGDGFLTAATSGGELVLNNQSSNNLTVNAVIANNTSASSLTMLGSGTAYLKDTANTYTGITSLGGGFLNIASDTSLGAAPGSAVANQLTFNGGTLQLAGAFNLSSTRGITLNTAGGTIDTQTFNSSYSGIVAGTGALTKAGSGTLDLVYNTTTATGSTFTGPVNVNAGTLELDASGNGATNDFTRASGYAIAAGATLQLNSTNANQNRWQPGAYQITGAGTFLRSGTAFLYFANSTNAATFNQSAGGLADFEGGTSTYAETATTNLGGLTINGTSTASTTFTVQGNAYFDALNGNSYSIYSNQTSSILTLGTNGGSGSFAGVIQNGSGQTLVKTGAGTQTLSGASTYSGTTTISSGTLRANNASGSATGGGNITVAGGTSNYGGGMLGGSGSVSGTVALAANSTAKQGGIIAAGASSSTTGKLVTASETWNGGAAYVWKIASAGTVGQTIASGGSGVTGTAGTWDDVSMSGLNVSSAGGSNAPITIALSNSAPLNSVNGQYSWIIAQASSTPTLPGGVAIGNNLLTQPVTGGSNHAFVLDTSNFTFSGLNAPVSASFSLEFVPSSGAGDNLVLDYYNSAPEPNTPLLILAAAGPQLLRRRRRNRSITSLN